jgi:6-pyruvoyltetrahydropterin/6-carboxytetrahydropterin synthase
MVYAITKDFAFSAGHYLTGLPPEHQCSRLHGHNYVVQVELEADDLVAPGFVYDYGELRFMARYLDTHLDHRQLNDVVMFNPTAENLARHLYEITHEELPGWVRCIGVGVSETPKTWAWYRPW